MTGLEHVLRRTLVQHADDAPLSGQLLRCVQVRHRHRQRRLVGAVACGLAVALGAAVLAMWPGPGVSLEPAGPVPPAPVAVAWQAGPLTLPVFPFRPAQVLPGLGSPVASLVGGVPTLRYEGTAAGPRFMTVSVATGPGPTGTGKAYAVHGHAAVYTPAVRDVDDWTLGWAEADRSITISGSGPVDVTALVAYAEGLTPGKLPIVEPFTFRTVPANLAVADAEPSWVTFRPDGVPAGGRAEHRLAVLLQAAMPEPVGGRRVTVGDRVGVLSTTDEGTTLAVEQPDGTAIVVQVPRNLAVTGEQLIAFAAGLRPTAQAVPGKG